MPIAPLRSVNVVAAPTLAPTPARPTPPSPSAATAVPEIRFALPRAQYKIPLAPGQRAEGVRPWSARLRSRFDKIASRALSVLGHHAPDRPAAIRLDLPAGDQLTSAELVAAIKKLDVASLMSEGIPPVAVFDFDQTLMSGDVFSEFAELAIAERRFRPEANPGVIDLLASTGLPELRRELLVGQDVNDNVNLAHSLMLARLEGGDPKATLSIAEFFFVLTTAMRGMTPADAEAIGHKLFEEGAPGKPPYRTHILDLSPGPNDSAHDLVAELTARGLRCHVVTAGLTFLARLGAAYLGIPGDHVVGGDLELAEGRFTGRAFDVVEAGKPALVRNTIGAPPLFAFGDSMHTDTPMLKLALIKGFMVDPRPAFLDLVKQESLDFVTLTFKPRDGEG